jgi:hydrogenase maturation factor HypF (carbamoyltransferase family)
MLKPKLYLRRILGFFSKIFSPGYSSCMRCGITWKFTKEHSTSYNEHSGCFPLCEHCWQELGTPENRLIYYQQLWAEWSLYAPMPEEKWDAIEKAVYEGR